jgi:hypothetical protein
MEDKPLRIGFGITGLAPCHHSISKFCRSGGWQGTRSVELRARPGVTRDKLSAGAAWFPTPDHRGDTVGGVGILCVVMVLVTWVFKRPEQVSFGFCLYTGLY